MHCAYRPDTSTILVPTISVYRYRPVSKTLLVTMVCLTGLYRCIADTWCDKGVPTDWLKIPLVLFGSVMYIADLQRAIYYQKCYDPDCRGMVHFTLW
ncbi:hypothetical protein GW17_00051450 [Ensete ventricosum]|nr:hypothetical protein GW17_00051450 [Ensete ventricosum]